MNKKNIMKGIKINMMKIKETTRKNKIDKKSKNKDKQHYDLDE